jgi:hypothetical protein
MTKGKDLHIGDTVTIIDTHGHRAPAGVILTITKIQIDEGTETLVYAKDPHGDEYGFCAKRCILYINETPEPEEENPDYCETKPSYDELMRNFSIKK